MSNNHLIIGLGGSGGKIIRQIRKTIERNRDNQGGKPAANFGYLYIDTSTDELDKKDDWKVLGKDVDLNRSEYLINTAGNVRPVLDDPASFPGLKNWLEPRHVFDFVKPGIAGAAQRRKLGRLVFAQNAPSFVKALEGRMHELEAKGDKSGAIIHVVCGLAGGTGSGSVVDAVAQIRHKFPNYDQYRILVYALLPEMHSKRVKDVAGFSNYYANGYAALAELNAMAVGKYHPTNVLDGSDMMHDTYFNGCYLVNNENEHKIRFEVETEVPNIVAEFIYQKAVNKSWEGLGRAEKGENDVKNFESDADIGKARAKLFLSFGIKRVMVPEQEIKEFMAYGFAEQAARQLMFNNFRQGEGYADEPLERDWGSEARKAETAQALLLTDAHLMLEAGILDDDARNVGWKPVADYWKQIVARLVPDIKGDSGIEQTSWIDVLNSRLSKVFDETYRTLGGVRKFYEVKATARVEMARHIGRHIEKDFFARWKSGSASLMQLRQLTDALVAVLDERQQGFADRIARAPTTLGEVHQRMTELKERFNDVGFFGKHLTDKRPALFSDLATLHQDLYILRTNLEGWKFANLLLPFVREQLLAMRARIDELHQNLATATRQFGQERDARLGEHESAYQKRVFDQQAIGGIVKAMVTDEQGQASRTQRVRQAIISLAGTEVSAFEQLLANLSLGNIIACLTRESAQIVELAHAEIAASMPPVLHVNIVERLQKQYDANPTGLRDFVRSLYDEAGAMLTLNKSETDRTAANNAGGAQARSQTVGVFVPECANQKDFHTLLTRTFEDQKDAISDTKVEAGSQSNQIIIMKISSLMPARFVDTLPELQRHYLGLLKDPNESFLLHGAGNGGKLPPLYAKTASDLHAQARRKPMLLAARLLGMLKERQNKVSGLPEWPFIYLSDGLPASKVLAGRDWQEVLHGDHPIDLHGLIEKEVSKRVNAEYQHIDRKHEIVEAFKQLARARFQESGEDDQDPDYLQLVGMQEHLHAIIGMPARNQ
ncbi:MAG: tubulin-like doman-containing protein [Burkholderiaceae bacterium]|nr:tubulin-like doman-containing protein [Burkholderiaceae bacterium]